MKTGRNDRQRRHDAMNSYPEPKDNQTLGLVRAACGANLYDVQCLSELPVPADQLRSTDRCLFELPKKLRNVVFIRPGSIVIVEKYTNTLESASILGEIVHALLPNQVDYLKSVPEWSALLANTTSQNQPNPDEQEPNSDHSGCEKSDDSFVAIYGSGNMNRVQMVASSDEEEDE